MKTSTLKTAFLSLLFSLFTFTVSATQVTISGATGIADGTSYTTLKGAFDAINANATQTSNNIVVRINGNTTETASAVLNNNATWASVNIYPTVSGLSISGNLAAPLIDLNGADNVTIDGRVDATGSTKDLIITNTSTSATAGTSTIRLYNGANANTIQYCTVKGSTMATADGVIRLAATSGFTGYTTANTTNLIHNNNITNSADANRPLYVIYSASAANTITISNNNIYDFFNRVNASRGINLTTTGAISITGNSFYETTSFVTAGGVGAYNVIYSSNATAVAIGITGNYFGGNAASASGTWTKTGVSNIFAAINLVGSAPTYTVQSNTISNISWSNTGSDYWKGIIVPNGAATIGGSGLGNTISNITLTNTVSGGTFTGISLAGTTGISCNYNTIQAITTANDAANATNFIGIDNSNSGSGNQINYNTIGHASNASSINAGSASSSNAQTVVGIQNTTSAAGLTISNNIIANMTNGTSNANPATLGYICGIFNNGSTILTINANSIHHLTIANANTASDHTASVSGIAITSLSSVFPTTNNSIYNLSNTYASFIGYIYGAYLYGPSATHNYSGNTIYNLSSTSTAAVNITGINFYSSTTANTVNNNFIYGISAASSSSAIIIGILKRNGVATLSNNIISLGTEAPASIYGIYDLPAAASHATYLYFNTIYIGSTTASGALNSYALYSAASTNTRNFRNNILQNARSNNGASGKHYAAYFNYGVSTALTLDYNDYYVTGTGGVLGYYNVADVASLPLISTFDVNSMTINPALASAGGVLATNYKPTSDKLGGFNISTVPNDYAAINRAASPTIGAYEVTLNLNVDVYKSNVFQASYFRIKDAFDKINSGTHTGVLELRVKANTTETASAVLYQSGYTAAGGTSNHSSVKIYPTASGLTISGSLNASIIDLNGADNVTIDGRVNQSGVLDMVISNVAINTYASAIKFNNSAENNNLKYCKVYASCNNSGTGEIYFASSASGNGNDNNTVEYCNITNAGGNRPANVIFSSGGNGVENSGNIIRYNNIYDFFNPGLSSNGINLSFNTTNWTITGNSFYETTTLAPTGLYTYTVIRTSTSSPELISDNYIGGTAPQCGGTAWTMNASKPFYFCIVYLTGGATSPCVFQNNTIKSIDCTSTEDNPWDGIYINTGNVNVTGNTLGATTGTGSIKITTPLPVATSTISGGVVTAINLVYSGSGYTTAPAVSFAASTVTATATAIINGSGQVTGFTITNGGSGYASAPAVVFDAQSNNYSTSHGIQNASTGTVNITGNNIGSITTVGSDYYSHGLEIMYVRSLAAKVTISNNLLGSLSTANSLQASSSAVSSINKQDIYGIYTSGTNAATISGNTISNLYNAYAGTNSASRARGISATAGSNLIQNNTVKNISSASGQNSAGSTAAVIGISHSSTTAGTTQTLKGNTISNLSCTNSSIANVIAGIYYSGPSAGTNSVTGNFIHSLSLATSNLNAEIDGIILFGGLTTTSNNIINLGTGISTGYKVYGIWDESGATNNNSIYFNSVYIGGTVSGTTSTTAALYNKNNTSTSRNYKNNLLVNVRSGGTTGINYAIWLAGMANLTIDYNDYYVTGSLAKVGRIGALDKIDLAAWKLGTSQDVNSLSTNPNFAIAGGTNALDYYSTATIPGTTIASVTIDYDGLTRGIVPKMGALEYNNYTWTGVTSTNFATATNWAGGEVPPNGANISFTANPSNHCILDQNRSLKNITNAQSSMNLVLNGKQLTLTGDLIFSNSAKLDATASASSVVFSGVNPQTIPANSFVNNTADSISTNNVNGVVLNCDFTVNKGLALLAGNLALGANNVTLNGIVTARIGTATGGTSTNVTFGGSGPNLTIRSFVFNNMTINRASGVTLYGNLTLAGTLTLTDGVLAVGANTLTLAETPLRTSGSIDASNAAANVIFDNASAITLPESIFSTNINNLSLSGAGGITSPSDITVNGELNLASVNPSATKGLLDMWDGATMKTLTMGANATTIGAGDVTGIVTRNYFEENIPYSFGNEFTTLNMAVGGTLPTTMSVKIILSLDHAWKTDAIHRYYDIIQTGGTSLTKMTTNLHYLNSELNGATEGNLNLFDYHITATTPHLDDHGRSNDNITEKWVGLANLSLTYIARSAFDNRYWTLGTSTASNFTWLGAAGSNWENSENWVGGVVPGSGNQVVIPDANTTFSDPDLPATATIGYLQVQEGGVLNGGEGTVLTIDGGYVEGGSVGSWDNMGTFNASTSTVIFTSPTATMSDPTNFYNVTIAENAKLTLGTGNVMRIAGELTLAGSGETIGVLNAANNQNTIEYNGVNQTIINPNGLNAGYHNLILSGSGIKTMPSSAMTVYGDLITSGTATVNAGNALTIEGSLDVVEGSTFVTGSYNHIIWGDMHNHGTFTASAGSEITMNGTSNQSIIGATAIDFYNLTIDNSQGVTLLTNENVNNTLTLTSGNLNVGTIQLSVNGAISKTAGFINTIATSSLTFGGTDAITFPSNLFVTTPSISNLTINRTGGVTLGNQNMTVNGLLDLIDGTFSVAANTLTLAGSSPTRTSGHLAANNSAASLVFSNTEAFNLPASFFATEVNNVTLNGVGGVTSPSDFTVNGILNLQAVNPSATKGLLDMWDGADQKILSMGANATTVGLGDVTGIIRRTSFDPNIAYTFGNQYSFITFDNGGSFPTEVQFKVNIGNAPSWKSNAILRSYELIRTGGVGCTASLSAHYLDSELNDINENELVLWNFTAPSTNVEYGSSTHSSVDNWAAINYVNFLFFPTSFGAKGQSLGKSELSSSRWNGSVSSSWTDFHNWDSNSVPNSTTNVIIPDASTTLNSPVLPASTEIKTLTIETAGVINSDGSPQLTVNGANGAWSNIGGTFNSSTGNVTFSNSAATISGATSFYNLTINSGSTLWMSLGSTMKIAGAVTNGGTWRTVINGETTVEYSGNEQTVVTPNANTNRYYNLSLSGSGVKTLPVSPLSIVGNLNLSGTASTTITDSVYVGGNVSLASGTSLTVSPTKILNVAGTISNNAGVNGLVIKSSSTQANGSLIYHNAYNAPVAATVEMYSKASKPTTSYKWQFFGIPLRTMNVNPTFDGSYIRKYNEAGIGSGFTADKRWIQLVNGNSVAPFTGYEVTQLAAKTFSFQGDLVNSDYNSGKLAFTLSAQSTGQHLIGNPYTAAIDIQKIEFGSSDVGIIENTIYLFNTGSYADWLSYSNGVPSFFETELPGQYVSIPQMVAGSIGLPSQIPSMQAFLVKVASDNALATVSIPYSATGTMVKNTSKQRAKATENASTRIDVKGVGIGDRMWLISEPNCTREFDNGWDGYKNYSSGVTQLFSMEASADYQVNTVDDVHNTYLGFQAGASDTYTMTFTHENIETQYPVLYLLDLFDNNKVTDITASGTTYTFTSAATSIPEKRFKIVTNLGTVTDNQTVNNTELKVYCSQNTIFVNNKSDASGTLYVCDIMGKVLQNKVFIANEISSFPMNLPAGAYVVKAKTNTEEVVRRIILD